MIFTKKIDEIFGIQIYLDCFITIWIFDSFQRWLTKSTNIYIKSYPRDPSSSSPPSPWTASPPSSPHRRTGGTPAADQLQGVTWLLMGILWTSLRRSSQGSCLSNLSIQHVAILTFLCKYVLSFAFLDRVYEILKMKWYIYQFIQWRIFRYLIPLNIRIITNIVFCSKPPTSNASFVTVDPSCQQRSSCHNQIVTSLCSAAVWFNSVTLLMHNTHPEVRSRYIPERYDDLKDCKLHTLSLHRMLLISASFPLKVQFGEKSCRICHDEFYEAKMSGERFWISDDWHEEMILNSINKMIFAERDCFAHEKEGCRDYENIR